MLETITIYPNQDKIWSQSPHIWIHYLFSATPSPKVKFFPLINIFGSNTFDILYVLA